MYCSRRSDIRKIVIRKSTINNCQSFLLRFDIEMSGNFAEFKFMNMKNLIVIISIMLIVSNSYSLNSNSFLGISLRRNTHEISDTTYKNKSVTIKHVKTKPGKAFKNNNTFEENADTLKSEKDNPVLTFNIDSAASSENICTVSADSAVFIREIKKEPLKAYTKNECSVLMLSGKIYIDVRISGMSDSSVNILKNKRPEIILIKDISSIKIEGKGFWKGALIGGGAALMLGFIAGNLDTTGEYLWDGMKIGIALVLPLAIVGGIFESKDTVYDMRAMEFSMKKKQIKYLMRYY